MHVQGHTLHALMMINKCSTSETVLQISANADIHCLAQMPEMHIQDPLILHRLYITRT